MKSIARSFLTIAAGLFITSWLIPGFSVSKNPTDFITITAMLWASNIFVKPLLKILFLPLNIATFGLFTIVINSLILYGITYLSHGLTISNWTFSGFSYNGFIIPELEFGIIATYIVSGFIIGVALTLVRWLVNE